MRPCSKLQLSDVASGTFRGLKLDTHDVESGASEASPQTLSITMSQSRLAQRLVVKLAKFREIREARKLGSKSYAFGSPEREAHRDSKLHNTIVGRGQLQKNLEFCCRSEL